MAHDPKKASAPSLVEETREPLASDADTEAILERREKFLRRMAIGGAGVATWVLTASACPCLEPEWTPAACDAGSADLDGDGVCDPPDGGTGDGGSDGGTGRDASKPDTG